MSYSVTVIIVLHKYTHSLVPKNNMTIQDNILVSLGIFNIILVLLCGVCILMNTNWFQRWYDKFRIKRYLIKQYLNKYEWGRCFTLHHIEYETRLQPLFGSHNIVPLRYGVVSSSVNRYFTITSGYELLAKLAMEPHNGPVIEISIELNHLPPDFAKKFLIQMDSYILEKSDDPKAELVKILREFRETTHLVPTLLISPLDCSVENHEPVQRCCEFLKSLVCDEKVCGGILQLPPLENDVRVEIGKNIFS